MKLLQNKKALILGIASEKSIAYGIAKQLHAHGAELGLTYLNDRFKSRVEDMANNQFNASFTHACDVTNDEEIENLFNAVSEQWGEFDILVHAIAHAPRELLNGDYLEPLTRKGFLDAHDISSYSFAAVTQKARPLLKNGSVMTLSYIGSQRTIPNYNIMGVAKASLEANVRYLATSLGPENHTVNAISAGPIRTLSASGIRGFKSMLEYDEQTNPMRRLTTIEDVGNTAVFLASDLSRAVTGEVIYVDNGAHIL